METQSALLQWKRRTPDWIAAAVAGFAAGAVLMVLDLLWTSFVLGDSPWRTSHMIAPIFTGADSLKSSGHGFSIGIVAAALAVHYALGIGSGLVLAAIMTPLGLDATRGRALLAGVVFGLVVYLVNFHIVARVFPWLAELRGWDTVAAHLVFGCVAALLYRRFARTAREA